MDRDDLQWFKSSYSGGSGTECVEAATIPAGTVVRDSKEPSRALIRISRGAWEGFLGAIRDRQLS